jgi:hypothetical protein
MHSEWLSGPAPFDNPDLVGQWTGRYTILTVPGTDLVLLCLDVFFPIPFRLDPVFVRSFHGTTQDELLERFGAWLDSVHETDTLK